MKELLEKAGQNVVDNVESVSLYDIEMFDAEYGVVKYNFTFKVGYTQKDCKVLVYDIIHCLSEHQLFSDRFAYSLIYHKDSKSWECRLICNIINKLE